MKIDCAECGVRILAQDLDLPTSMAKCRECNAVFSFANRLQGPVPMQQPQQPQRRDRLRAPRPDGLEIHDTFSSGFEPGYRDAPRQKGTVTITRRWFTPVHIFLVFFCIVWDGFLVNWYSSVLGAKSDVPFIFALFPLLHVGVGVGLTYYTIAGFFNRTTFHLDENSFSVRHGPLPWKGNRTLPRDDIKQLYCEHEVNQSRNGPRHSYYLSAVLRSDDKLRLASIPVDQAKYIEEVLEERLGIVDMEVPGEVGGKG